MENLGRLAFKRHLEREHCSELICKCLEEATNSVKDLGIETEVKIKLPEVERAVDHSKYYGQFRVPDVAPPKKPDQAMEESYICRALRDQGFRMVKVAAIKAQGANIVEKKVRLKLQGIHVSLYVADEDATASAPLSKEPPLAD
jgi:predicted ATPase